MLYKFAAALGFTAFFMMTSFANIVRYAVQNSEQFAFNFGLKEAAPLVGTVLGLEFFFPALFVIVCLAAGCVAAEITFNAFDMTADLLGKTYSRFFIKKVSKA